MLRLVEDRERIDAFLDKLLTLHTPEHKRYQQPFICTGAAVQAAKHLIEDMGKSNFTSNLITNLFLIGGRILVFASSINSIGAG